MANSSLIANTHYILVLLFDAFFSLWRTAPFLALAYLHETLRFTSVY
jgi:hypothetical protein